MLAAKDYAWDVRLCSNAKPTPVIPDVAQRRSGIHLSDYFVVRVGAAVGRLEACVAIHNAAIAWGDPGMTQILNIEANV